MFPLLKNFLENPKKNLTQALAFLAVASSSYMMWRALGIVTNTESPVVVVLTGSMRPAFSRGDLLFLSLGDEPFKIGEIVVFKIPDRPIPIVHRVLSVHVKKETGEEYLLTKGDDNSVNDRELYSKNQLWLKRKHIVGRVKGHLPYLGMFTIILNDTPYLKYALIGIMALFAFFSNEEQ